MGESRGRKANEQALIRTIVILIRNTTWRCGRLEKSIVNYLHKKRQNLGKKGISIKEIMLNLNMTCEKKDECIDAIKRLEKRNIVILMSL